MHQELTLLFHSIIFISLFGYFYSYIRFKNRWFVDVCGWERDKWRHESQAETPSVVSTRRCRRRRRSTHAMRSFKSMPPWLFLKSERAKRRKKNQQQQQFVSSYNRITSSVCRWNENEWERMLLSHAHFANIWVMLLEVAKSIFGLDWRERIEWWEKMELSRPKEHTTHNWSLRESTFMDFWRTSEKKTRCVQI